MRLQTRGGEAARALPAYDRAALRREMELMPEWFFARHLDQPAAPEVRAMLERLFAFLEHSALAQPATFVHRDYHSRNLLVSAEANPGILDFQDAVRGAVTYDAVSLLKDLLHRVAAQADEPLAARIPRAAARRGLPARGQGRTNFVRWFDPHGGCSGT